MMKKYPQHKKVDSLYIDQLPIHWEKLKVKHLVNRNSYYPVGDGDHGSIKPSMYTDNGIPYIRVQNLSWTGKLDLSSVVYINKEVQQKNLKSKLIPGDILIAKTGATVGKLALIPDNVSEANTTSSVGKLTVDHERFSAKYILYSFQSKSIQDQIWMEASQKSAQPGFNIDNLIEFELYAPHYQEQTKIAEFLDHQTGIIDALIQKKEQLIEKLKEQRQAIINEAVTKGLDPNAKMKDSGVEWLGEIPEGWEFTKVKNVLAIPITDGPHTTPQLYDEGIPFLSADAIKNNKLDFNRKRGYISIEDYEEFSKKYIPEKGDIYMVKSGATTGNIAMVETDEIFTIWSPLAVFRANNTKVLHDYLFLVLQSTMFRYQVELNWSYGTQQNIGMGVLSNLLLTYPNLETQNNIVKKVANGVVFIEKAHSKIENQIEKLREYRQSIISEAVTGKVDVREWEPKTKT